MSNVVAGIDVSKNQLYVHVAGENRQFANQRTDYRALSAWLEAHRATRVVLEATGRYHRAVHQSLHARGIEVVLANPLRTRRFAEALGLLAKADTIDAAALAAYGTAFLDLPATPPRSTFLEQLADLLVLREQHRDAQMSLRQAAAEVQDPDLREEARHSVGQLARQVDSFDQKVRALIASEPDTNRRYRILVSIPGVGPVSAAALCCWMPELGHLGNRQAAALLGVAPFARDSGRRHGTRHIRGGRQRPRKVLYMAALSASMHNPDLQRIFLRLKAAGKCHKVAIVAIMRKLIVLANVLLRDARPWAEIAPAARA